jgi:hypothetical protein
MPEVVVAVLGVGYTVLEVSVVAETVVAEMELPTPAVAAEAKQAAALES